MKPWCRLEKRGRNDPQLMVTSDPAVFQASFNSEPVALYSLMYSRGVGTRSAAFYTAWAQQLERRGMSEQAEAVFQKALENQAQPADSVLHEYRYERRRLTLPNRNKNISVGSH